MSEIKLRADEARSHADDVKGTSEQVLDTLGDLRRRMDSLVESFSGKSSEAFMGKLDEWKTGSDQLMEALDGLGTFLNGAADAIEDTDEQLANQLNK